MNPRVSHLTTTPFFSSLSPLPSLNPHPSPPPPPRPSCFISSLSCFNLLHCSSSHPHPLTPKTAAQDCTEDALQLLLQQQVPALGSVLQDKHACKPPAHMCAPYYTHLFSSWSISLSVRPLSLFPLPPPLSLPVPCPLLNLAHCFIPRCPDLPRHPCPAFPLPLFFFFLFLVSFHCFWMLFAYAYVTLFAVSLFPVFRVCPCFVCLLFVPNTKMKEGRVISKPQNNNKKEDEARDKRMRVCEMGFFRTA